MTPPCLPVDTNGMALSPRGPPATHQHHDAVYHMQVVGIVLLLLLLLRCQPVAAQQLPRSHAGTGGSWQSPANCSPRPAPGQRARSTSACMASGVGGRWRLGGIPARGAWQRCCAPQGIRQGVHQLAACARAPHAPHSVRAEPPHFSPRSRAYQSPPPPTPQGCLGSRRMKPSSRIGDGLWAVPKRQQRARGKRRHIS
jgi:hypothetical protein